MGDIKNKSKALSDDDLENVGGGIPFSSQGEQPSYGDIWAEYSEEEI